MCLFYLKSIQVLGDWLLQHPNQIKSTSKFSKRQCRILDFWWRYIQLLFVITNIPPQSSSAIQLRIFVNCPKIWNDTRYSAFTTKLPIDSADTVRRLIFRMKMMWYCLVRMFRATNLLFIAIRVLDIEVCTFIFGLWWFWIWFLGFDRNLLRFFGFGWFFAWFFSFFIDLNAPSLCTIMEIWW